MAHCSHCLLGEKRVGLKELTINEIEKISQSLGRILFLLPTGGEPFLRDDIAEIVHIFYRNNKVANAGCVLVGNYASVVLGDYIAGPSHVLPTGGTARFSSPLNITVFIKFINAININEAGLKQLGKSVVALAEAEGLDAHARAVEKRLQRD